MNIFIMKFYKHILILILIFNYNQTFSQKIRNLNNVSPFNGNNAFTFGEKLTYKLKYSLYLNINVGEVTFEVKDKPRIEAGRPHYYISVAGSSYSFYSGFFEFNDRYETTIDIEKFLPKVSIRIINEGTYHSFTNMVFDHNNHTVKNISGKSYKTRNFTQDILFCHLSRKNF